MLICSITVLILFQTLWIKYTENNNCLMAWGCQTGPRRDPGPSAVERKCSQWPSPLGERAFSRVNISLVQVYVRHGWKEFVYKCVYVWKTIINMIKSSVYFSGLLIIATDASSQKSKRLWGSADLNLSEILYGNFSFTKNKVPGHC